MAFSHRFENLQRHNAAERPPTASKTALERPRCNSYADDLADDLVPPMEPLGFGDWAWVVGLSAFTLGAWGFFGWLVFR